MKYNAQTLSLLQQLDFEYEYCTTYDLNANTVTIEDLQDTTEPITIRSINDWINFYIEQFENKQHYEKQGSKTWLYFQDIINTLKNN